MHLFHRMYHGVSGELVAVNEIMQLHVNQAEQKVTPMRADLHDALAAIAAGHAGLERPKELGRVMGVRSRH